MDQGLDLRFYLGALRRRFFVMLLAFIVVAGGAVAVSILLPPVFQSEAKIIVESQQIPTDLVRSTVTGLASERLQVIQQRITAREVMLALVEKFGLFADGEQQLTPSERVDAMRNSIAIEQFNLGTNRGRGGGLAIGFTVGFQHRNPQVAARVANELVTLILAEDIKARTARASETTQFIEREFEQRRKELAAVEAQISAFKLENDRALPEKLSYLMSQAEWARGQLASLEREIQNNEEQARLLELELSIRQANSGSGDAAGFTRTAALQQVEELSAELTRKRSVYTDSHPDVKALRNQIAALEALDEEAGSAVKESEGPAVDVTGRDLDSGLLRHRIGALERRREILREEREDVADALESLEELIVKVPEVQAYLGNLERQRDAIRTTLEDLGSKLNEARLGERLERDKQAERFEVIEQPVTPTKPIKPNRPLILAGGLGLAGGVALAIAFLLELLNRTVRLPADILNALGQSPMATIPYITTAAEVRRRRARMLAGLLLIAGLLAATLLAIQIGYMPLDEVVYKVLTRFGI